jgi:hypothetical protein
MFQRSILVDLGETGFSEGLPFVNLRSESLALIPDAAGVYAFVCSPEMKAVFLERSPAGWFKGRDPTVSVNELERKWVAGARVVYIGKADNLRRRMRQRLQFAGGRPVGAWGGRYLWQIDGAATLIVGWKLASLEESAIEMEARLLGAFRMKYGTLPFANLR